MSLRTVIVLLAVVGVGGFALGGWMFRSQVPAAATTALAPVRVATAVAAKPNARGTANIIAADVPRDALLMALRAKLPGSLENLLITLAEIGRTNPALAIDLAHELGRTDREKAAWVTQAMQRWADRDPAAAWQWLEQLTSDRMQALAGGELGSVVLGAMAARDPQMVIAQLDGLLRHGNASESISTAVAVHLGLEALVQHGQVASAKSVLETWARDPQQLALEAAAFETAAMSLVKSQPAETGAWLRSLPANEERNAAFATFAATWAKQDPRGALQWAETLAPGEGQQAALRRTVSDWIEEFPDQVSGWLGDYLTHAPAGPTADVLIETVINNSPTLRTAPKAALQWTGLLSDPAKQVDYHEKIAVRWAEQDVAAALDFVAKSTVIPGDRKPGVVNKIQLAQIAGRPGS